MLINTFFSMSFAVLILSLQRIYVPFNIAVADYCVDVCQIIKTKTNTFAEAMLRNYKAVARNVCTWYQKPQFR